MAKSVADVDLLYRVMAGPVNGDPYGQAIPSERGQRNVEAGKPLNGLRVAWLPTCGNRIDREVLTATESAVRLMELQGAAVETIDLDFVSIEAHFLVILESLIAARTRTHLDRYRDEIDPSLIATAERGLQHSAVDLQEASFARTRCFNQLQDVFNRYDVLVSPTVSAPPLPVDQDPAGIVTIDGQPAGTIRGAWYPYTYPMNLTGHPAISLPCGLSEIGLPIGLQLVGGWYQEDLVLAVASWLESALLK